MGRKRIRYVLKKNYVPRPYPWPEYNWFEEAILFRRPWH